MHDAAPPRELLTSVADGMRILGVKKNSIYSLINTHEIEAVRIFSRTLLKVASLHALCERGGTRLRSAPRARKERTS